MQLALVQSYLLSHKLGPRLPLHISRAFCWLHLFPRFTLVTLFPYLALLHTFPSLPLAKCFPALRTGYNFSRSCNSTLTMNALASVKRFSSYAIKLHEFFLSCFYCVLFLVHLIYPGVSSAFTLLMHSLENLTTQLLQFVRFSTL